MSNSVSDERAIVEISVLIGTYLMHNRVMKALAIDDPQLLNLWVYRARQQLAPMRLCEASKIIERRERAGQIRLGLKQVRIIEA